MREQRMTGDLRLYLAVGIIALATILGGFTDHASLERIERLEAATAAMERELEAKDELQQRMMAAYKSQVQMLERLLEGER